MVYAKCSEKVESRGRGDCQYVGRPYSVALGNGEGKDVRSLQYSEVNNEERYRMRESLFLQCALDPLRVRCAHREPGSLGSKCHGRRIVYVMWLLKTGDLSFSDETEKQWHSLEAIELRTPKPPRSHPEL